MKWFWPKEKTMVVKKRFAFLPKSFFIYEFGDTGDIKRQCTVWWESYWVRIYTSGWGSFRKVYYLQDPEQFARLNSTSTIETWYPPREYFR